jgi:hypothetical protein
VALPIGAPFTSLVVQVYAALIKSDQYLVSDVVLSLKLAFLSLENESVYLILGEKAFGMYWPGVGL